MGLHRNAEDTMSIRIGRALGVPIDIHASCIIALIILSVSIGLGFIAPAQEEISTSAALLVGGAAAVALFVCLLAHELAHAIVARKYGVSTGSVTLFVFGGAVDMNHDSEDWRSELTVAVAGPIASFLIALLLGTGYFISDRGSIGAVLLFYLAFANAVLAIANLVPGYPLDGGRVLKAILWRSLNDRRKAARVAVLMGECIGIGLAALGIAYILEHKFDGLWLLAVGWYLTDSAARAWEREQIRTILEQSKAADIITDRPSVLSPDDSVGHMTGRHTCSALPVADDSGPVGVVSISKAANGASEKSVREIMASVDGIVVSYEDNAWDVAERVGDLDKDGALVVADGRNVIGVVEKRELPRLLTNRLRMAVH